MTQGHGKDATCLDGNAAIPSLSPDGPPGVASRERETPRRVGRDGRSDKRCGFDRKRGAAKEKNGADGTTGVFPTFPSFFALYTHRLMRKVTSQSRHCQLHYPEDDLPILSVSQSPQVALSTSTIAGAPDAESRPWMRSVGQQCPAKSLRAGESLSHQRPPILSCKAGGVRGVAEQRNPGGCVGMLPMPRRSRRRYSAKTDRHSWGRAAQRDQ